MKPSTAALKIPFLPIILLCLFGSPVQAQDQPLGISLQANQTVTNDGSESLVYVTGQVLQLASGAETTNQSELVPAASVEVRFWQPDSPHIFFSAQTDDAGNYVLGLDEGVWVGEACGSGQGYYPAAWNLLVENQTLKDMRAIERKRITLDFLYPSNLVKQFDMVTLRGSGFGCNGSLVFTYSNSVNICDEAQPVEYQQEPIRLDGFNLAGSGKTRTDTELRFQMPELHSRRGVTKHVAFVHYEQGGNRSDRIPIGETILVSQASNPICTGEPVDLETSVAELAEIADEVVDLPDTVNPDGAPGNPQTGGGYNPNGLTSLDFGVQAHLQAGQLGTLNVDVNNVTVPGGF